MASDPDELARTATALVGGTAAPAAASEAPATLGRYRLERELGAGGMGMVYAAFDPDLERRVALKVLRVSAPSVEAKDRLMREARAMARLSHANVVTVHEVGTAHGRDFVAMELIHGDNLAEWLRAAERPAMQIIDAFIAAGRGLAAAHAAGIVHRDFKPHNVLRSRDGRIVVTDFGLAREAQGPLPPALDTTLPTGTATAATTPSSLGGLTVTGSLLGTPAYMAPEQWNRGAVTPATDQFAYCVALWEALTGARPYPGPTLDDLRAQVARGPDALDASKIPRRLRKILRRGLDPAPSQRWPSMDALLAQLVRVQRRPVIAIAAAAVAAAIAVAVALMMSTGGAPIATCAPPARPLGSVWSPVIAAQLVAQGRVAHAEALAREAAVWQDERATACAAAPTEQPLRLQCLDAVLRRMDAARQGFATTSNAEGMVAQLVEPRLCNQPLAELPRLTLTASPDVVAAYAMLARAEHEPAPDLAPISALATRGDADPCARVIATLAFDTTGKDVSRARQLVDDSSSLLDQCADDRLRADLLITTAHYRIELPVVGPRGIAAVRQARTVAARVMQPDVGAALALAEERVSETQMRWEEALKLTDTAFDGFGARGLRGRQAFAVTIRNRLYLQRGLPDDLAAVVRDADVWQPVALTAQHTTLAYYLAYMRAAARYRLGDLVRAHGELMVLHRTQPEPKAAPHARPISGEVVDARGAPVAGATVAAGTSITGDAITVAEPIDDIDDGMRFVTTDEHGRFTIPDAPPTGPVVAEHGALRSAPVASAPHVRLVLRPTRSLRGRVQLGSTPHTTVSITSHPLGERTGRYRVTAPIAPDGSFTLAGVTTGAVRVAISYARTEGGGPPTEYHVLPAGGSLDGVELALPSSDRVIDIVVRSELATPLDGAQVVLVAGKHQIASVAQLVRGQYPGIQVAIPHPTINENVPKALLDKVRRTDLTAHVEHASRGDLTVCGIAFTGDLFDPEARRRLQANIERLTMRCAHLSASDSTLVLEIPPQQWLE